MSKVIHRVVLDVTKPGLTPVLDVVNSDSGRLIHFYMVGIDLTGYSAKITVTKPSKAMAWNDCTVSENIVIAELTNQMLAENGPAVAQIEMKSATDGTVSSFPFILRVANKLTGGVESKNESTYIEKLLADVMSSMGIDATLTKSGYAADAAAVGQKFSQISEQIADLVQNGVVEVYIGNTEPTGGQVLWIDTNGENSGEETHTHSYTSKVTKEATCTETGIKTYTCSCGNSYTETIPVKGHTYVNGICTVCGATENTGGDDNTGDDTGGTTGENIGNGEYQKVEYIETVGSGSIGFNEINTGIQCKDVSKIKMGLNTDFSKYVRIADSSADATGKEGAVGGAEQPYIYNTLNKTEMTGMGYDSFSTEATPSDYVGKNVYVDFTFDTSTTSEKYYLFGDSGTNGWNTAKRKIYYIELYNSSDELIANFIPCYRISDEAVGMYDLVRNSFYLPVAGKFSKGVNVE